MKKISVLFLVMFALVARAEFEDESFQEGPHKTHVKNENLPAKKALSPLVTNIKGASAVDGKEIKIKDKIASGSVIETKEGTHVQIQLDKNSSLQVLPNSEVEITYLEDFFVNIKRGSVYYVCKDICGTTLMTGLSENVFPTGEFVVMYNHLVPETNLFVIQGDFAFSGKGNEETQTIKSRQKGGFVGVIEEGQVIYDTLLKGKKFARGNLKPVVDLSKSEVNSMLLAIKLPAPSTKKTGKAALTEVEDAKALCHKPSGLLNQCQWLCLGLKKGSKACDPSKVGVSCVRSRCAADGEWKDQTTLEPSENRCGIKPLIADCDY